MRELAGDGYTIEVGIYEAVPGLPVPAHLYLPGRARARTRRRCTRPGTGWRTRGSSPTLQRFNVRLARAGIAVLCYDPIGQGERRAGWHEHGQLAPLLAGFTSLGVMVAETPGARSTCSPPAADVDAGRLGRHRRLRRRLRLDVRGRASTGASRRPRICCILNTHLSQLRDAAYGTGWDGWVDLCNQVPRLAATRRHGPRRRRPRRRAT